MHHVRKLTAKVFAPFVLAACVSSSSSPPTEDAGPIQGDAAGDGSAVAFDGAVNAPHASPDATAFQTTCQTYYNDWFGGGAPTSCVQGRLGTCVPLQSQATGCSPDSLTQCETSCGGSSNVNNAANCGCIETCVASCLGVTEAYYACEISGC